MHQVFSGITFEFQFVIPLIGTTQSLYFRLTAFLHVLITSSQVER